MASLRSEIDIKDEIKLRDLAENMKIIFNADKIYFDKEDITNKIRAEDIGVRASKISIFKSVRKATKNSKGFCTTPGLVADGRDMGSVVFPKALLKIFLSADQNIRAERRYKQLIQKEIPCKLNDLLLEIKKRDKRDFDRPFGSLNLAKEVCSIHIDTSYLSIEEVVQTIICKFNKLSAF